MAQQQSLAVLVLALVACSAVFAEPALAKKQRKLGYYRGGGGSSGSSPASGSSPVDQTPSSTPYSSTPSGSSPVDQTPSSTPYSSTPSGSSPVDQTPSAPSGSSPVDQTPSAPYGSTPSGSSPVDQTPSTPYGSSPSGSSPVDQTPSAPYDSSPSSSSPVVQIPPVTSAPSSSSPVTIPPVTSTPTGGYSGYGSRSGKGTCDYWRSNPSRVPRVLSLVSSIARLFGPRLLKVFSNRPTMYGALKDESPEAMPSLAREASASLINAYTYHDFPLRDAEVVALFNNALESPQLASAQAAKFQQLNEGV